MFLFDDDLLEEYVTYAIVTSSVTCTGLTALGVAELFYFDCSASKMMGNIRSGVNSE